MTSIGLWLVIGIYSLAGDLFQLSGSQAFLAFPLLALLMMPTLLSWAELISWIRGAGGAYRLVRAAERPVLSFVVGLAHVLGWIALGALLAQTFARYTTMLLAYVLPPLPDFRLLVLPLILFFALANLTGYQSRRKVQLLLLSIAALALLVLVGFAVRQIAVEGASPDAIVASGSLLPGVVLLAASMWATNVTFEMQSGGGRPVRVLLISSLGGPAIGLLLAVAVRAAVPLDSISLSGIPLLTIAGRLIGQQAIPIGLGIGSVAAGAAWQVVTLAGLRQISAMGARGWLPGWLYRPHQRFGTPHRLILIMSIWVLIFVTAGSTFWLGRVSAMTLLLIGTGISATAFLLNDDLKSQRRRLKLPFGGLVPLVGIAVNVILLAVVGLDVLLFGALWIGLGFALFWRYSQQQLQAAQRGVTVFYEEGDEKERVAFTVLVAIGDAQRDVNLVSFAEAIARQRDGEVVALHVVHVPDQLRLDSGRRLGQERLTELERVTDTMETQGVPIRARVRLSRGQAQGILDAADEEDPDLIVMGWNARPNSGAELGHILDEVLGDAASDVVVVRGDWPQQPARILVPTRGGLNAPLAVELGLGLTADMNGEVALLNVVRNPATQREKDEAAALLQAEMDALPSVERVVAKVAVANNPVEGILAEADTYDAVMLGATEESFLDQAFFGRVPELIARQTESPVAMVRRRRALTVFWLNKVWDSVTNVLPTLERDEQLNVYTRLRRGARPSINYFILITLSAVIATLGLLLNSPAVIIGAMLVAPLMTPIVSTAIGISFGDVRTLRLSIGSTLQGILAAIFVAIVITRVSPLRIVTSEILARTQPTLLDLFVALASGFAGAYAIARKELSDALPGVAVAAALMPPVCTIGVGLALFDLRIAGGAALLFTTNLIAITVAATVVFLALGIRPPEERERRMALRRALTTSAVSLLIISLPLAFILFQTTGREQLSRRVEQTLHAEFEEWGNVDIERFSVERGRDELIVTATLRTSRDVGQADVDALDSALESRLGNPVQINLLVVPVSEVNSTTS